jgi:hypothetical protein
VNQFWAELVVQDGERQIVTNQLLLTDTELTDCIHRMASIVANLFQQTRSHAHNSAIFNFLDLSFALQKNVIVPGEAPLRLGRDTTNTNPPAFEWYLQ